MASLASISEMFGSMQPMLNDVINTCSTDWRAQLVIGAVPSYLILSWLMKPRLYDSYFPIKQSKLSNLKYIGKHSSKIPLNDIPNAIAEMKRVYQSNITRRVSERKKQLKAMKRLIQENEDAIMEAIRSDLGRCKLLAAAYEIFPLYGEIDKMYKHLEEWSAPRKLGISFLTFPSYDVHVVEPYGTVFVNGIWNFPIQLALSPVIGAIAAGNNVIVKPCNTANKCALLLADLLHKYMDSRFVQVLGHPDIANGDDYVVTGKILESKFDLIFFTGSSNGGKYIMKEASKFLTPVVLELGGKNPVLVDDSANLTLAAKQCVYARVINCGQQCISPDYVLCYESVCDKFIEECTKYASKWYKTGSNLADDLGGNQGKIINKKQLERVKGLLKSTKGQIVFGGKYDEKLCMFEPTIVRLKGLEYANDEPSLKTETFGPILWVLPIEDKIETAVDYINENCEKSLSLYLFSNNKKNQDYVTHNTSSGAMQINGTLTYAAHHAGKFGGVGMSGMGNYHGRNSFETFSHCKTVVKSYIEMPLMYPPYDGEWKRKVFGLAF